MVVRRATVGVVGARVVGYATIVNSGRGRVRPTVGFLSLRPVSGGDLTGVAGFSVPGLAGGASTTVHFKAVIKAASLVIRPGRYAVLVCLDVDSQIQAFVAKRNCVAVGAITIARGGSPGAGSSPPDTIIRGGPSGVVGSSSVVVSGAHDSVSGVEYVLKLLHQAAGHRLKAKASAKPTTGSPITKGLTLTGT